MRTKSLVTNNERVSVFRTNKLKTLLCKNDDSTKYNSSEFDIFPLEEKLKANDLHEIF